MENDFDTLQAFVDDMKSTPSTNKKQEILNKYSNNEFITKILLYVNNPYWTYGVTSSACQNYNADIDMYEELYNSIFDLLDDLRNRKLTGHKALHEVNKFIYHENEHEQLIYNIIDKDIETRANATLINKVIPGAIPEFKVALANKYEKKLVDFNADEWYCSRKLDGVRCICRIEDGNISFFSRTGKTFNSLGMIKVNIKEAGRENDNIVLDGEICIVDENGNEDFQGVMKVIRKKDYIIKNPKYFIFDCMTLDEFDNRTSNVKLKDRLLRIPEIDNTVILEQISMYADSDLDKHKEEAKKNGWEGVMLRKNVGYKGKRSNDLLKVKTFTDAEYKVKGVINDSMRFFENGKDVERITLSAVIITHKGNTVKVGSGFSKDEREYYYSNPNEIIGKVITVQYFEETTNEDGGISLRFPVFIHNYGEKRID